MTTNYLKTGIRSMLKSKLFTVINILGLALGLACCLLIFMYVQQEFAHEDFHEKADRLFRLTNHASLKGQAVYSAYSVPEIGREFQSMFPQIKRMSGYRYAETWIEQNDDYYLETIGFVDSTFLQMFTFPLLAGDPDNALKQPQSVVLTKEEADKIFPNNSNYADLLGQTINMTKGDEKSFLITGVLESIPKTSSLPFSILVPFKNCRFYPQSNDNFGNTSIYFELDDPKAAHNIEQSSAPLVEKIFGPLIQQLREAGRLDENDFLKFELQPVSDIYFNRTFPYQYEERSNPIYSYILSLIALFILLIACINFITLSLARAYVRTGEISVRKVLGAGKGQILQQFLGEALLTSLVALVLAVFFAELLTPFFNTLAQTKLKLSIPNDVATIIFLVGLLLVVSLATGLYPGLFLSKFKPMTLFRSATPFGRNQFFKSLLSFQFVLSILLIVSTLVILRQVAFMRHKDVGFAESHVLSLPIPDDFPQQKIDLLREQIKNITTVINATGSDRNFIRGASSQSYQRRDGELVNCRLLLIDADYLPTLGIELVAGRNFWDSESDVKNAVLVNETLVRELEIENPIGFTLTGEPIADTTPNIVGVVKDFHFDSMRRPVKPLILHMNRNYNTIWSMFVKIQATDIPETIKEIQNVYGQIAPGRPFQFSFLDEDLDRQYKDEQRWGQISTVAALLAILISSLGLLGVMSMAMNQRVKEIGIRKALGASVSKVVLYFLQKIIWIYIVAIFIAVPIAWFSMNKWLQGFAFRIHLSWWIFALAGALALALAVFTVSWQAIRAATANPVEALRYE